LYYLTKEHRTKGKEKALGEGRIFYSPEEVVIAFNEGKLDLHALIHVRVNVEEEGKL
jgi:DNA-directed RNA polymerase subunit beta'